jgi:hypothetical protein
MITPIQPMPNVAGQAANPNSQAMLQQFMQGGGKAIPAPGQGPSYQKEGLPLTLGNEAKVNLSVGDGQGAMKAITTGHISNDPAYQHYLRLMGKGSSTPAPQPGLQNSATPINWSSLMSGQGMG